MKKYLSESAASFPVGACGGKKLFKVASGEFAGRIAALYQSGASEIKLAYADYPYVDWSTPVAIISDCADFPFDAAIDPDGNIYLTYTLGSNNNLVVRRLLFTDDDWSAGALITIYDADDNFYHSIVIEPSGRLWVGWSRLSAGSYYINVKFSDDNGATWPNGSSSPGTTLTSAETSAFGKLLTCSNYIYVVYTIGGITLAYRRKHYSSGTWDTEINVASGSNLDADFDSAVSDNGKIGVVFDDGTLRFREYDGDSWSAVLEIDTDGGEFPQIKYFANEPYLVYLSSFGTAQKRILYTRRIQETFSTPAVLDSSKNILSKLFCYSSVSGTYQDLTTAASSETAGDIFHSASGAILNAIGDAVYLGMENKFNFLKLILSQTGSGGTVVWQYYDGTEWRSFTPESGEFQFNLSDKELLLWDDYLSIPSGWQKKTINGAEKYWVRAIVVSPFTTAPVGTQITTVTNPAGILLME